MIFETPRLLIRRYAMEDVENFLRLNTDAEVMRYIRPVQTKEMTFKFFLENVEYYKAFPLFGRWAMIEKSNQHFIGSFMLRPSTTVDGDIELGYAMFKNFWGKGFASEAVNGGLDHAFDKLGLQTIIAITHLKNSASQKVLLKCGFTQEKDFDDNGETVCLFRKIKPAHG